MLQEHIWLFLVALVCEIAGTVSGFGSSVLFVPLAGLFLPRTYVLGITSMLHVFSNSFKLGMFRQAIKWRLFLLFGIPSLIGTVAGAMLAGRIDPFWADLALGIFLMAMAGWLTVFPDRGMKATDTQALLTGGLAGFVAGLLGTGGAIRGAGLAAFGLAKDAFVATSAAIDFGVDFSRMFIYYGQGFIPTKMLWYIPSLFLASWLGTWVGKRVLARITQENFRRIVLAAIALIGLGMVIRRVCFS